MTDKNLNRSRRRKNKAAPAPVKPKTRGLAGGYLTILSDADMAAIDAAAKAILWQTGVVGAPHRLTQKACDEGAVLTQEGRLQIPPALTSKALSAFAKPLTLYGRKAGQELHLGSGQVYTGTGGAAPLVLDEDGSTFREAGISDLFKAARLAEALEHIHFFSRPVVARDIETPRDMDIATAFTSLKGTSKHIMTSVSAAEDVAAIADICFTLAGSEEAFREKPFLSLNINHITPPLRLAEEAVEVMAEAIKFGLPVQCNTFGQLGASSPVPLAGSLAQTCAETLAGLVMAWLIDENAKAIFGPRPMVTDLRTGAMSGGSGEQALIMAATAQMANYYQLPNSVIAGATDAKTADAQSGFEKSLNITLAAQAGANLITQACGMHAGLMAAALESYVIDSDMAGAILRSLAPIEVSTDTLMIAAIDETAKGAGHFLGHADTYARMHSDFLYPELACRLPVETWTQAGAEDIHSRARKKVRAILSSPPETHIPKTIETALRQKYALPDLDG